MLLNKVNRTSINKGMLGWERLRWSDKTPLKTEDTLKEQILDQF